MLTKEQEATWKYDVEHKNDGTQRDALVNINQLWPKTGNGDNTLIFLGVLLSIDISYRQKSRTIKYSI